MILNTNSVYLEGTVVSELLLEEDLKLGERIYSFFLKVPRLSGKDDIISIRVSNRLANFSCIEPDTCISLKGEIRTRNKLLQSKRRLLISVFCHSVEEIEHVNTKNNNVVEISGVLCKKPLSRKAKSSSRNLCEMLVMVVKKTTNKTYFIPAISWGRYAEMSSTLSKDDEVSLLGRLQSRDYIRHCKDADDYEKGVAYELSVESLSFVMKTRGKEIIK